MTAFLYVTLTLVVLAVIADRLFGLFVTKRICEVFENVPPFGVVPADQSSDARKLSIPTPDGLTLSGSLHPPLSGEAPRAIVIFCPELNGNHWMAAHYCHGLLANGFAVISFDFRNQGSSDCMDGYGPIHWTTEYEMNDIAGVLEFIESDKQLSTLPMGIFGVSRGGVSALAAACRYPRIRAVLADSAFGTMAMTKHFVERFGRYIIPEWFFSVLPEWHINRTLRQAMRLSESRRNCRYVHLENEVQHLDGTVVRLVSGKRDSYVSPAVADSLAEQFGGLDLLWIVDRAKHNMARKVAEEDYDRYVIEHFSQIADPSVPTGDVTAKSSSPQSVQWRNSRLALLFVAGNLNAGVMLRLTLY